jgi:hypothetical protein
MDWNSVMHKVLAGITQRAPTAFLATSAYDYFFSFFPLHSSPAGTISAFIAQATSIITLYCAWHLGEIWPPVAISRRTTDISVTMIQLTRVLAVIAACSYVVQNGTLKLVATGLIVAGFCVLGIATMNEDELKTLQLFIGLAALGNWVVIPLARNLKH